ncbi:MAG TPA: FecR domain-containing protein [Solimonas sp.]
MNNKKWVGALMALVLAVPAAMASPGKVVSATNAEALRSDGTQRLKSGDTVQVGDQLVTGNRGQLSWVMDDGASHALAGNASLTLDQFSKPASNGGGGGRLLLSLTRGAFRAISGLIGKVGTDEYRVETPVATMGIRGTTYAAAWCQDDCYDLSAGASRPMPNGLYVLVEDGLVEIRSGGGTLLVKAGQRAYVPAASEPPRLVKVEPRVFLELEQIMFDRLRLFEGSLPELRFEIDVEVPASPS